jgi:hypothetical protein
MARLPEPPLNLDYEEWRKLPYLQRLRPLVLRWAEHGADLPAVVLVFYLVKLLVYLGAGVGIVSLTPGLGSPLDFPHWWSETIVYQKIVVFTMLFEVLGLGGGAGPLNFRFQRPFTSYWHWFRPGTIRQPPWPRLVPATKGDTRTLVDVLLFGAFTANLLLILLAPGQGVPAAGETVGRLGAGYVLPAVVLLAVIGLRDKTIFLAARAEMYWVAMIIFMFPGDDMMIGLQLALLLIWWGAGFSKLTRLFPYAVTAMLSNSPGRPLWFKRMMYRDVPSDIRPSLAATVLTHVGSAIELGVPFLLLTTHGYVLAAAVAVMVIFHLHIISTVPVGTPNEWNVFMIFGVLTLFWAHRDISVMDTQNPLLIVGLVVVLAGPVLLGNFRPDLVSFLPGMRYYAANWATSLWCFKDGADSRLAPNIIKASGTTKEQLAALFSAEYTEVADLKVRAWRSLHPHGRALNGLLTHTFGADIGRYSVLDGELLCGAVMGWNFGDGHLHDERLLASVQKRCRFGEGELVVIILESQPLHRQRQRYRIVDAVTGRLEDGYVYTKEMVARQPWLGDDMSIPLEIIWRSSPEVGNLDSHSTDRPVS